MGSFPFGSRSLSKKKNKVKTSLVAPSNTAQFSQAQPLKVCMGTSLNLLLQPVSHYLHKVSLDTLVTLKILSTIMEI